MRAQLHLASVPDTLLCRVGQRDHIAAFCDERIALRRGAGMYISGSPGLGKSLTARHVLATLRAKHGTATGTGVVVRTAILNAFQLREPGALYRAALAELFGVDAEKGADVRALLHRQPVPLRALREAAVALIDAHRNPALLQRQRHRVVRPGLGSLSRSGHEWSVEGECRGYAIGDRHKRELRVHTHCFCGPAKAVAQAGTHRHSFRVDRVQHVGHRLLHSTEAERVDARDTYPCGSDLAFEHRGLE